MASQRGLRITGVEYALMTGSDESGREPLTWDYDTWHEPTYGCQLAVDIGVVFTFTWGNTFGCYGLEVVDRPIEGFLVNIGEPCGPAVLSLAVILAGSDCWGGKSSTPSWPGSTGFREMRRRVGCAWTSALTSCREARQSRYGSPPDAGRATGSCLPLTT